MSIFSPSDRELPLLTHIAQVNIQDVTEVRRFWAYYEEAEETHISESALEQIMQLSALAQRMLPSLLRGKCRMEDIRTLRAWRHNIEVGYISCESPDERGEVSISSLEPLVRPQTEGKIQTRMAQQIILDLWGLLEMENYKMLRRCHACEHIFLRSARHPGQTYCSARCNSRIRRREQRRKKREKIVPPVNAIDRRNTIGVR